MYYYRMALALLVFTFFPVKTYGQAASARDAVPTPAPGMHVTTKEAKSVLSATTEKALVGTTEGNAYISGYLEDTWQGKNVSRLNSLVKAQEEKIALLEEKIKVLEYELVKMKEGKK